jgi:hypothetical protein
MAGSKKKSESVSENTEEEAKSKAAPAKPLRKKSDSGFIKNLDDVRKQIQDEEKIEHSAQQVKKESEEKENSPQKSLDKQKFHELFDKYLEEELKPKMISLYNSLKENGIKFPDEYSVLFEFENASLHERFQRIIIQLSEFMNKHGLSDFNIKSQTREISKEEKSRYLTSSSDIYNHLKEKNPELKSLKDNLGLTPQD